MKTLVRLVLQLSALLCAGAISAHAFEGTVHMTISNGQGETHQLAYSLKNGLTRIDINVSDNRTASAILDLAKDEMIVLMPGQPFYMTMSIKHSVEQAVGQAADEVTLEKTAATTRILGYPCTKYLSKSKDGVTEIWATDQLGGFSGLGNMLGGPRSRASKAPGWEKAVVGKDFFPLRVISSSSRNGNLSLEVTAVEPKSLPDSLFAPPPGSRKFDMGGMMPGMGGGNPMEQ
ncbi:MAG: DUF4412 domain-containing protein [Opitutales bacterium]